MAKYVNYESLKSVKDALALLSLLTDKNLLAEVKGILQELESEREKINEKILVYGQAKKIPGILQAGKDKLVEVSGKSISLDRMIMELKTEYDSKYSVFQVQTSKVKANLDVREKAIAIAEKASKMEISAANEAISLQNENNAKLKAKSETMMAEALELRDTYEKKASILKDIMK